MNIKVLIPLSFKQLLSKSLTLDTQESETIEIAEHNLQQYLRIYATYLKLIKQLEDI